MTYEEQKSYQEPPEGTRFLLVKLLRAIEFNQKEVHCHCFITFLKPLLKTSLKQIKINCPTTTDHGKNELSDIMTRMIICLNKFKSNELSSKEF